MADATSSDPSTYDELGLFHENAEEAGLDWHGPPTVRRVETDLGGGRTLSGLRWGTDAPQIVLLHGGCWQNAYDQVYITRLAAATPFSTSNSATPHASSP